MKEEEFLNNFYFKQPKRLQQELDIKEKMLDKFMIGSGEILEKLQKENDELKARFNELYNNAEQLANKYNRCSGNKENELVEIINKATDERNKYKQALEEISILAKNYCNACDEFKAKTLKNKNDCLYCNYGFIRRKINEVLNDRD